MLFVNRPSLHNLTGNRFGMPLGKRIIPDQPNPGTSRLAGSPIRGRACSYDGNGAESCLEREGEARTRPDPALSELATWVHCDLLAGRGGIDSSADFYLTQD